MGVYVLWLGAVLLCPLPRKKPMVYSLALGGLLTLLLGARHPAMGVDLGYGMAYGYLPSFRFLTGLPWKQVLTLDGFQNYERGYLLFNKLAGSVFAQDQWFLLCCAGVSVLPIAWVIGRYSKNRRLSFLIYFGLTVFQIPFSGLRQAMAAGLAFLAFPLVRKKRLLPFLLTVGLAAQFHNTAWTAVLLYPLYWIRPDRTARLLSFGVTGLVFALREPLWNILAAWTGRGHPAVHSGDFGLFLLFCAVYFYLILFSRRTHSGLVNIQWLCCCTLAFTEVSTVAGRVSYYSMLALTLTLPEILDDLGQRFGQREWLLHSWAAGLGFVLLGFYNLTHSAWAGAVPYRFFWQ